LASDELNFFDHLPGSGETLAGIDGLPKFQIEGTILLIAPHEPGHDDAFGSRVFGGILVVWFVHRERLGTGC
jgi:hypothetical protein